MHVEFGEIAKSVEFIDYWAKARAKARANELRARMLGTNIHT